MSNFLEKNKINAVICEFNPFHNGHQYIINEMKKQGLVICVMSGNFVQRGDVAILDKWARAKTALLCGADLVLELPVAFSTANAQTFSLGSVEILNSLGIIDNLFFGTENGNIKELENILNLFETTAFQNELKLNLNKGKTFAKAREDATKSLLKDAYNDELAGSNNNLALEYLSALKNTKSNIKAQTVKRQGANHDTFTEGENISAMQIREYIKGNILNLNLQMPTKSLKILENEIKFGNAPALINKIELAILCKLRTMSISDFANICDISEGLENRLFKAVREAVSLDDLYSKIKSKRYPLARIRRIVLHSFLDITKKSQKLSYIKVLAMNENGKNIIKNCKKNLPIIGKSSDVNKLDDFAKEQFALQCKCDDIYNLCRTNVSVCGDNYTKKIITLD